MLAKKNHYKFVKKFWLYKNIIKFAFNKIVKFLYINGNKRTKIL